MKRKKNVLILLLVLVMMIGAVIGIKSYNKKQDVIKNSGETVIEFDVDEVSHIDWTYGSSKSHSFTKSDGSWKYDGDDDFPVDGEKLEDLISELSSYAADFVIEEPDNLSDYGLSKSTYTVNIELEDGTEINVSFGSYSSMDSERYFSLGDGKVYLAVEDVMNDFYMSKDDFALEDTVPEMNQVLSFSVSGENNLNIVYEDDSEHSYTSNLEYFIKSGNTYTAIDTDNAEDLIEIISDLNLGSIETYTADTDNLSKWKLDDPGLSVSVVYEDENKEQQSFTVLLGSTGSSAYARIENSVFVYTFAEADYESILNASYETLRTEKLESIDWTEVTKIQVSLDGSVYEIGVSSNAKGTITYRYQETECEAGDIIDSLDSLEITEFDTESSFKKKELSLVVYQDNESYPQISLDFYRVDGESCMAFFAGEQLGLVSRETVIDMVEECYDLFL